MSSSSHQAVIEILAAIDYPADSEIRHLLWEIVDEFGNEEWGNGYDAGEISGKMHNKEIYKYYPLPSDVY